MSALAEVLSRYTKTPGRCWFCLWDGWNLAPSSVMAYRTGGSGREGEIMPVPALITARVQLPHRDYQLFEGPLKAWGEMGDLAAGRRFVARMPNLFWPDDHAWLVATEIDLDSTYVGGSRELVTALLDDPRLEVWQTDLDDQVTVSSDEINRQ